MKKFLITTSFLCTFIILKAGNPPWYNNIFTENSNLSMVPALAEYRSNYIYPEWGYYIEASPGISFITNDNLSSDIWDSKGGLGYTFSLGYFRSISPYFKIKAGVAASSYSNSLTGNGEVSTVLFNDIDNDIYTESLTLENADNEINTTYISVPLIIEFGNTTINRIGFYVDFGVKYSYLFYENYKTTGKYTTKGTYEQWGVTLQDIEELGFYTSRNLESNANFRKNIFSVIGGFGITIPLSSSVIFKVGFTGDYGLTDIGNNRPVKDDSNPISDATYNYRSEYIDNSLAVLKDSKTRQIGFEFGFFINKRVK